MYAATLDPLIDLEELRWFCTWKEAILESGYLVWEMPKFEPIREVKMAVLIGYKEEQFVYLYMIEKN